MQGLRPDGQLEPYTWIAEYASGELVMEIDPNGGATRAFSEAVDRASVHWLGLLPQLEGLPLHRVRVPEGAEAWFVRRRRYEGVIGVNGSEHLAMNWTGIGWRRPDGSGPSLFACADGSTVLGEDDLTLTEEIAP